MSPSARRNVKPGELPVRGGDDVEEALRKGRIQEVNYNLQVRVCTTTS